MRHSSRLLFAALVAPLLIGLLAITGCVGTKTAYKEASGVDEYAYVLTEHYSALVSQAATLAALPTTPASVKERLKAADRAAYLVVVGDPTASPRVVGLAELAANYKQIRNAENQLALQRAVDSAVLKVADLVRALRAGGAR